MGKAAITDPTAIIEEKLKKLQKAYAELEDKQQTDRDVYNRLLGRLTLACKGQNLELDNKLAELRTQLADNQKLDDVSQLVQQVDQLLNDHARYNSIQVKKAKEELGNSCKRLQSIRGLTADFRKDLRSVVEDVNQSDISYISLISATQHLSNLYRNAMDLISLGRVIDKDEQAELEELKQTQREIASTIHDLLTEFEFEGPVADKIQTERRAVVNAETPSQALVCCTNIIELVLKAIEDERESSQTFLSSLNNSLTTIHSSLRQSVQTSNELVEVHKESTEKLRQQVSVMNTDLENATYLDELKEQISTHLGSILDVISEQRVSELESSLQLHLGSMQDRLFKLEQQAQEYKARLDEQKSKMFRDSVTELPNRTAYDERIDIEYQRARRYTTPLTLAIIDIDHFKRINDNYGHIAGDKTLKVLGQMLNRWLRKTDFVARYGGEEFVLLLPDQSISNVRGVLERLCDRISKLPFKFKQEDVRITVSIGAAGFQENDTVESLFERADKAMYRAKNNGRNQVVLETEE